MTLLRIVSIQFGLPQKQTFRPKSTIYFNQETFQPKDSGQMDQSNKTKFTSNELHSNKIKAKDQKKNYKHKLYEQALRYLHTLFLSHERDIIQSFVCVHSFLRWTNFFASEQSPHLGIFLFFCKLLNQLWNRLLKVPD